MPRSIVSNWHPIGANLAEGRFWGASLCVRPSLGEKQQPHPVSFPRDKRWSFSSGINLAVPECGTCFPNTAPHLLTHPRHKVPQMPAPGRPSPLGSLAQPVQEPFTVTLYWFVHFFSKRLSRFIDSFQKYLLERPLQAPKQFEMWFAPAEKKTRREKHKKPNSGTKKKRYRSNNITLLRSRVIVFNSIF